MPGPPAASPSSSPPQVPPAPLNKDDFALVQRPGPGLSQEAARRYGELTKLIRQQHEVRGPPLPDSSPGPRPAPPTVTTSLTCVCSAPSPLVCPPPPDVPEPFQPIHPAGQHRGNHQVSGLRSQGNAHRRLNASPPPTLHCTASWAGGWLWPLHVRSGPANPRPGVLSRALWPQVREAGGGL